MQSDDDDDAALRSTALQNIQSILAARQRAGNELRNTKEALEEQTRVLELLNRGLTLLASNLDLQSVLQSVTDAGTQLCGAQFGAFFHLDHAADHFTLFTLSGAAVEQFESFGNPRATPLFAPTFAGEVVRIGDVRKDPRYGRWAPHYGMPKDHLPVRSYLAVPVISRSGLVIGGLFFGHREPDIFTERSEQLIRGFAAQAAIAIDNARLYGETKRAAEERARLLEVERETRAQVERVSLMKDEFLATLSHELRSPLNAMLGWSQALLANTPEDDSTLRRGLLSIARNARAQAQLIDDLLDMSRIVSGKIRLDVQSLELTPIIEATLDSVRPSADAKAIEIRTHFEANPGSISGDPQRLQQVIWNLLTNAVKFTPRQGRIEVTLRRAGSSAVLTVRDSGIGISADFLPHLFERFRQADSSTTRKYGGLGLGLSIVKQLVELHGGHIEATSSGTGQGSAFTVSFPIRAVREDVTTLPPEPNPRHTQRARDPQLSLTGIRVLVVDDEQDARELVSAVLSDAAAEVWTAPAADDALTLLEAKHPDVIVSDIGMPERDGYQFMQDVRSLAASCGGATPAIALTAFARSEDRARALLAGYQIHIAKPVEPHELLTTIRNLVEQTRAQHA